MTEPETTPDPEATAPVEDTSAEDASDAALRAWARDNGVEGVPASGRLSASWREQITSAMAAASLDPKEEATAEATSTDMSTSETTTEDGEPWISDPEELAQLKEELDAALEADKVVEYRTPWEPPDTWVTGQSYTA